MSDLFCSFMYFRSLTNSHNLPLFLPPKLYYSSPLHSHNSRISTIKRSSPPHLPLLFKPSPFVASASDIDVISIHEHSDGSLLFRFGHPSEIQKNAEREVSKDVEEEIEGEDNNGFSVVKIDDETEVTKAIDSSDLITSSSNAAISVEGENDLSEKLLESDGSVVKIVKGDDETVVTEATDGADLIVSNGNAIVAVEEESELSEKLLESTDDDDLPLLVSNEEKGGVSTLALGIELIENKEGLNEEFENSSPVGASISDESLSYEESQEEASNVTPTSTETESTSILGVDVGEKTINVEECVDQEDVGSLAVASILDQRSELVDEITTVALSEKGSDGITSAYIDADQTGKVEEFLNQEDEDSLEDESILDQSSEVMDNISTVALSEKESDGITSADVEVDQTQKVEEFLNQEESMIDQSSEVVNNVSTVALLEKESYGITSVDVEVDHTQKVEECLNQEDEDSPADESMLDQSSEVVDKISTVALSDKESDDNTSAEADQTGKVVGVLNEDCEDSPVDDTLLDESPEVVNGISVVALLEKETDGITSISDIDIKPTGNVEEGLYQEYKDSPVYTPVMDKTSEILNSITTEASSQTEIADITSASDIEIENSGNVELGPDEVHEEPSSVEQAPAEVHEEPSAVEQVLHEEPSAVEQGDLDEVHEESSAVEQVLNEVHEEPSAVEQGLDEVREEPSAVEQGLDDVREEPSAVEQGLDEVREEPSAVEQGLDEVREEPSAVEQGLDEVHEEPSAVEQAIDEVHEAPSVVEQGLDEVRDEPSAVEQGLVEVHEEPSVVEQGLDEVCEQPSAVEQGIDEVHEELSAVEQGLDKLREEPSATNNSKPDVNITAQDFDQETADPIIFVDLKTEPVDAVLETDAYQSSLESAVTTNLALSEHQNVETAVQDKTIGEGRENLLDNLVSPSPQMESEPALSSYKETKEPNSQKLATEENSETEFNNVKSLKEPVIGIDNGSDIYDAEAESPTIGSVEQASESRSGVPDETVGYISDDMIQLLTVPPQLEADSMFEKESSIQSMEDPKEDAASENETVGADLVEASVHEVTAPESAESIITNQETLLTDFVLSSGATLLPHPSKVSPGGEDAYFVAGRTWLGVADGVSQWSLEGTIPGDYAHELIKNCEKLISGCNGNSIKNPIELLNLSVAQTYSAGSSTVLIAQFDGQALHIANVGDSGFIVLRHGTVYKRSSPMHHAFSLPVHIERGDNPSSLAQLYRIDLEEEDVIVVATDGLLDNLYDQEISLITMKSLADDKSLEEIAALLANKAQEVGGSASARSPFADEAQAAGFPGYTGGKLDDVAVIVSLVQRR